MPKSPKTRISVARPKRRLTQGELDDFLRGAADKLRGNVDHSEFRGYVFALLFFKRISDVYDENVRKLLKEYDGDEEMARDPYQHNFVVPVEWSWDRVTRTAPKELGTALNDAMIAIERTNQPRFDGILTNKIDFAKTDDLPRDKLVSLINHFSSQVFDHASVSDAVFGDAYEYLVRDFASKAGKSSGEFYTPKEVAYLMAEMVEPREGHSVCDWASGAGGLLLQCRNYIERRGGDPNRLHLYAQESNVTTYNISRINMILHGVNQWTHAQGDSLRSPRLLDDGNRLLRFDRVVMNPPFSLEDWGYDDVSGADGDKFERFGYGLPPAKNGDYAWLQQVVATLNDTGRAIVVMSQGVLFRGQPEQTEEEDGRNQKADDEYLIREAFLQHDLIECVVVLPSKIFYGNSVPACLLVLNPNKAPERKNRVLMIWASRHYQKANPQNILRPSDLMRILVPWRAFGDVEVARLAVAGHEAKLIAEEEAERDRRLKDIEDAYALLLAPLPGLKDELDGLEAADWKAWCASPNQEHPFFGPLYKYRSQPAKALNALAKDAKVAYAARLKEVKGLVKDLGKLQSERDAQEKDVSDTFNREIEHLRGAAADLERICSAPDEAARYFAVAEHEVVEENEFNLNLPRYVDTFEPEEIVALDDAVEEMKRARVETEAAQQALQILLGKVGASA